LKKGLILALMVLITMLAVPSVQAITMDVTYDITSDHATGGLGTPPFGTVELSQDVGFPVEVTVTLNEGYYFVMTGAADNMYFKFNGAGAVGNITFDGDDTPSMVGATGSFNGDGTGAFSFGITAASPAPGNNPFYDALLFDVSNVTINDLIQPNADGIIFVADIYSPVTGKTGPADVTTPSVPEPTSLLLLGSSLIGLWAVRKKFKK
jgi:hypothetical protein